MVKTKELIRVMYSNNWHTELVNSICVSGWVLSIRALLSDERDMKK